MCFLQAPDLRDDMYLDALNSLLISGEYPPLFSVDELDSLLQVLYPFHNLCTALFHLIFESFCLFSTGGRGFCFKCVAPPPHSSGNSTSASYFSLKSLAFNTLLPPGISNDFHGGVLFGITQYDNSLEPRLTSKRFQSIVSQLLRHFISSYSHHTKDENK